MLILVFFSSPAGPLQIRAASTVVRKNANGVLPLKKPRSIALVGSDAGPGKVGPNKFADQVPPLASYSLSPRSAFLPPPYFAKAVTKGPRSAEAEFFEGGKVFPESKSANQEIDKAIISSVKTAENLTKYLEASWGLSKGQFPLVF
ncbi:hypothetical protein C8F04DRAFT_1293980 [Mycena alexandri]|uniref:Uncharacterized protein n=1 Tax=Mycena alexandri TaxID=1745969 RepID=A0AAD6WUA5_9AGAR|nr:hypothetical protein C8F04DRAFT_1293980 [Mycena alexandri]